MQPLGTTSDMTDQSAVAGAKHRAILEEASKISKEVDKAVEDLKELEKRMQDDSFQFGDATYDSLDMVSSTVRELECSCRELRDSLESETISWSNLTHAKQVFPNRMRRELEKTLGALRTENTKQLNSLRESVGTIEKRVKAKEERLENVRTQVATLRPKLETEKEHHEEDVEVLNEIMARKARARIKLNEQLADDADTVVKTQDVDAQLAKLLADLEAERAAVEAEIEQLKVETDERKKEIEEKEDESFAFRNELADLKVKVDQVRDKVKRRKAESETCQQTLSFLEQKMRSADEEFAKADTAVREAQEKGREIEGKRMKDGRAHKERMENMAKEQADALANIDYAEQEVFRLKPKYDDVKAEYLKVTGKAKAEQGRLESGQTLLEKGNASLRKETQDFARYSQEVEGLIVQEEQLVSGLKAYRIMAEERRTAAKKQLGRQRETTSNLRTEHQDIQNKRDNIVSEKMEASKVATAKFETVQKKCDDLESEAINQTQQLLTVRQEVSGLKQDYTSIAERLTETKTTLTRQKESLTNRVDGFRARATANKEMLESLRPLIESLQEEDRVKSKKFEEEKRTAIELKNVKASYIDQITRADREIEKLHIPQERLRGDIRTQRSEGTVQLQEQCVEAQDIERRVFHAKRRVDTLCVENQRFEEAITTMDDECARTSRKKEHSHTVKKDLEEELTRLKGLLATGWEETASMEKKFSADDRAVIGKIDDLMKAICQRNSSVKEIQDRLERELSQMERAKQAVRLQ